MMPAAVIAKLFTPIFAAGCSNSFFGFPSWWKYLAKQPSPPSCDINFTFPNDLWAVGLAVIDMLLYAAGMVAIFMIIFAGVGYITAGGNPEKAATARRRIYNSLIGLGIVMISISVVRFIGGRLGG